MKALVMCSPISRVLLICSTDNTTQYWVKSEEHRFTLLHSRQPLESVWKQLLKWCC